MTDQKYRWLLFDADGTLFDFEKAQSNALARAFESAGVLFEPAYLTTYRQIDQQLWHSVEKGEITPAFLKNRRHELLFENIGMAYPGMVFGEHFQNHLADSSELLAGAADVLLKLSKSYRMAILTNGLQSVQRRRFARSPICQHMAEIIISEEIGFSKPAREFFDITLDRLGNPALEELLMIGDSWTADIMGAVGYGIDACWYNPDRKPRPSGHAITREISSLQELSEWLL